MRKRARRQERLEQELLALDEEAMLLEELDGFVAGLLVCPELIKPSEWLSAVWGGDGEEQTVFDDLAHYNRVLGLVMEHYNEVASTLVDRPDRYAPLLTFDSRTKDIIWELWISGFNKAVKLRPGAWKPILADSLAAEAFSGLLALADVDRGDARFSEAERDAMTQEAPDKIGPWVLTLNQWRLANRHTGAIPPSPYVHAQKTGRNDPCPCGSGKKYKKCCGLN